MGLVHRTTTRKGPYSPSQNDASVIKDRNDDYLFKVQWRMFHRRHRLLVVVIGFILLKACVHRIHFSKATLSFQSPFEHHPIMILLTDSLMNARRLALKADTPLWIENRKNNYWIDHGVRKHKSVEEIPEGCVPEGDWMNDHHPSCNVLHEHVDMLDFFFTPQRSTIRISNGHWRRRKFKHISSGGFRSAFLFHEYNGTPRVLKTLLYSDDRDFTPRMVDKMRRDAVASEQLTASPYVVDIYGYCGQSSLVDYSDEDDMLSLFKHSHKPSKDELFQYAHDVAQSVADAHHFNKYGRATMAHMDIKPNQWIYLNGKYMLNDFNLVRFLTWDPVHKVNCHHASAYSEGRWQAPEQFIGEAPRSEKADTFSLGYVLNFLLTGNKPFPNLTGRQVQDTVVNGTMWKITDPEIVNSTHPFDISVREAVEMCLVADPDKRPNAQDVADVIRRALIEYNKTKEK